MDIQEQLDNLQKQLDALRSNASIPYEVDQAFRRRFNLDSFVEFVASSKTSSAENVSINEAGAATKTALGPPDGFRQHTVGGTTIHIPFYNT